MFSSLYYRARSWPVVWRSRLFFYWLRVDKGSFGFVAMLALPVIVLGSIVYFAYADGMRAVARQRQQAFAANLEREAELRCLAENVYHEARGEPMAGQYAVAEVTLNRVASPYYPKTICQVVYDSRWDPARKRRVAAFSWTQQEIARAPRGEAWRQAMRAATAVYENVHTPVVPDALFYHATSVDPYWARTRKPVATVGHHVFYR
jgi:N-acetylmuramoyl-L-alanine amidase